MTQAPLADEQYEFEDDYHGNQLALAAVMIAEHLVRTARFDQPSANRNLDFFVTDVSGRWVGFCDPKIMTLVPWYANIATRDGFAVDRSLSRRATWVGSWLRASRTRKSANL